MKYPGSKNRIAKYILPIMLWDRKPNQWYVEPFVGGGNMIDKVIGNRFGSDLNNDVIKALKLIRDNLDYIPRNNIEYTEIDYRNKSNELIDPFASFSYSFGGKQWGGWSRDKPNRRDYVAESYRNATKQSPLLQGVILVNCAYNQIYIPQKSVIYCDPPYEGTYNYKTKFDHEKFWEWCRKQHINGHKIFISEYNAPNDFLCIWKHDLKCTLSKNSNSDIRQEKLFTLI